MALRTLDQNADVAVLLLIDKLIEALEVGHFLAALANTEQYCAIKYLQTNQSLVYGLTVAPTHEQLILLFEKLLDHNLIVHIQLN